MPRRRNVATGPVVHRTARIGLRLTRAQRQRCFGLLRAGGDVWACILEINTWHRRRGDKPVAGFPELCGLLAASGPGTFGELDSTGARSVLRRYSDAWFSAAARRKAGHHEVRYPRRRRALMPIRWYHGTFTVSGRQVRLPAARGCPPVLVRLDRSVPYPPGTVRSVTLLFDAGRLWLDVTAELPVATYPPGTGPDPGRVAGVDLGIIHPYAAANPADGTGLLISGRAIRAEHRMHLADTKHRRRATAGHAPKKGQKGSRRWRKMRRRARLVEARHRRRTGQALHEATTTLISWAVEQRIGVLTVGDPRGVLNKPAGRRHNLRLRQWQLGRTLHILQDKAALAGIRVHLVDERGTSSTCPACHQKISKPRGRTMTCPHCTFAGHRDLAAAFTIATRTPGGAPTTPAQPCSGVVTHRRAGRHLPGAGPARRDPRRRPPRPAASGSLGRRRPAPPALVGSRSLTPVNEDPQHHRTQPGQRSWTPH
ncbi:RNA-guided endonuclease InsQ/TnpB family protein [Paractinoplanes lichenicola]|uniref:Transposase n=1 Tax=Paractinoplanes lichenicola TaxID=2802976 RepID=A0ABS1VNR3_9ACTN|nr:RNA-guided endonuclease TnpB family protein [Actinoplanes lichenicola]MBL7256388.1 transposase [Actinoplanes lichenicola]